MKLMLKLTGVKIFASASAMSVGKKATTPLSVRTGVKTPQGWQCWKVLT